MQQRLVEDGPHLRFRSRPSFTATILAFVLLSATMLRRIYARARNAKKRPDGNVRISLSDIHPKTSARDEDLVALDEALSRLEILDARVGRVVELRYFTGLSERETSEVLGISISTLKRDWNFAKAWLLDQLAATDPKDRQM
jgi:RNA polymerase sigma factor (TIGR02999 family)